MHSFCRFGIGLLLMVALSSLAQRPLRFTLPTGLVDLTNSFAEPGHVLIPLLATNKNIEVVNWSAAVTPTNVPGIFEIRLTEAAPVGSIISYGATTIECRLNGNWQSLPLGAEQDRALKFTPVPTGQLVDAIRLRAVAMKQTNQGVPSYRATLPFLTVIPVRAINIASEAKVTANSTNSVASGLQVNPTPQLLIDGLVEQAPTFQSGPRESVISSNAPEWIMLTWPQPRPIRGIATFLGNADPGLGQYSLEAFEGLGDPMTSTDSNAWVMVRGRVTVPGDFYQNQMFVSSRVLNTRGLRLLSYGGVHQIGAAELVVMTDLGQTQTNEEKPPAKLEGAK